MSVVSANFRSETIKFASSDEAHNVIFPWLTMLKISLAILQSTKSPVNFMTIELCVRAGNLKRRLTFLFTLYESDV